MEDILMIRLQERLKTYSGLPYTRAVRNSLIEEIREELRNFEKEIIKED